MRTVIIVLKLGLGFATVAQRRAGGRSQQSCKSQEDGLHFGESFKIKRILQSYFFGSLFINFTMAETAEEWVDDGAEAPEVEVSQPTMNHQEPRLCRELSSRLHIYPPKSPASNGTCNLFFL